MYRIFNERKYIETYIKKGFKDMHHLNSDMQLYIRWLKLPIEDGGEGHMYSKVQCKEQLLAKLKKIPYYNIMRNMKVINRNIDTAWKNKRPLLNIENIPVTCATMNWFKKQGLRKNEIKLLFTIYMGYRIRQYTQSKESSVYFDEINDRFFLRTNSNITSSSSIKKMLNVFKSKNFWDFASFTKGSAFKISFVNLEDFIEAENNIESGIYNFSTDELHEIGNTLYRYYDGHKFCLQCGKMIDNINSKKYCEYCASERKRIQDKKRQAKLYIKHPDKEVVCKKCGNTFTISANGKRDLCDSCYNTKKANKELTCVQCGNLFTISSRGQRVLCDECYAKKRKQDINNNAKQHYKKMSDETIL